MAQGPSLQDVVNNSGPEASLIHDRLGSCFPKHSLRDYGTIVFLLTVEHLYKARVGTPPSPPTVEWQNGTDWRPYVGTDNTALTDLTRACVKRREKVKVSTWYKYCVVQYC